jgi:DNA modification methylase
MIIQGNCLDELKKLPDESVDCCVTSPPYWGLRDYGVGGQFGLEKTPEEYVKNMVEVFREVKRVLKKEGTLWLNLGDSYNSHSTRGKLNLKDKDLVGIPWSVAFALRADGWYLRQDIIWHKPNPMPESVTDRCTKSHEYIFLLAKSQKYYFDNEAIREEPKPHILKRKDGMMSAYKCNAKRISNPETTSKFYPELKGANKRSVWTVTTKPFKEAHFATFPEDLILPCVLAGCPKGGVILDPFFGAGTTGVVAKKNNRDYIGLELNPEYVKLAEKRINNTQVNLL